jgi:hypothetical protein
MRTSHAANGHLRSRRETRVRAARRAARERLEEVLRRAEDRACLESARCDAPARPSLARARRRACERFLEGRARPVERGLPAWLRAEALPFGGGGSFTPAFLAFESPMAIACLGLRTPCLPLLTW